MLNLSPAGQAAMSHLEKIENAQKDLFRSEGYVRSTLHRELTSARADTAKYEEALQQTREQAAALAPEEKAYVEARCHFHQGLLHWAMSAVHGEFATLPEHAAQARLRLDEAVQSLEQAVALDANLLYQFYLGLLYEQLDQPEQAVAQLKPVAAQRESPFCYRAEQRLEYLESRIKAAMPEPPPPSLPEQSPAPNLYEVAPPAIAAKPQSSYNSSYRRQKQPDWGEVAKGVIALLIGLMSIGIVIGIPIACWGLFLIARGLIRWDAV